MLAPTAIGFLTWAYALSHTDAGRMGWTTYLVPPAALLLGWAILGEVPPLLALPGGILCLAGAALARLRGPVQRAARGGLRRPLVWPPMPSTGEEPFTC